MNNIFEKISLTLILLKIFDTYLCHYFATNKKIAITHLWHAIELQTICHLIVKDKVAEQHTVFALVKNECETDCLPSLEKARQL